MSPQLSPQLIREMLNRRPFVPFRICLSDRRTFDITRPALLWPGNRQTWIGILRDTESDLWDEAVIVNNLHITSLDPIVPERAA